MFRFTLDITTEFLFGSCMDSLSSTTPYPHNAEDHPAYITSARGDAADAFAAAFQEATEIVSNRERSGWTWPLREIFEDKAVKPMKIVNAYLEPIVKDALEKKRNSPVKEKVDDEAEDGTLLDHLVSVTDGKEFLLLRNMADPCCRSYHSQR